MGVHLVAYQDWLNGMLNFYLPHTQLFCAYVTVDCHIVEMQFDIISFSISRQTITFEQNRIEVPLKYIRFMLPIKRAMPFFIIFRAALLFNSNSLRSLLPYICLCSDRVILLFLSSILSSSFSSKWSKTYSDRVAGFNWNCILTNTHLTV